MGNSMRKNDERQSKLGLPVDSFPKSLTASDFIPKNFHLIHRCADTNSCFSKRVFALRSDLFYPP